MFVLVIISITRYRDIDRGLVERTISWRPYIVRYRARTHVSRVRCSHTAAAAAASASDWCRLPCTLSVDWLPLPRVPCGRPIMQRIGSLEWGLQGRQLHQWWAKRCAERPTVLFISRSVRSRNDINTATPVQCPLTLTPACCCVRTSQCNVTQVLVTNMENCMLLP